MLKFFNKKGKKVMEMQDNGEFTFLSEDLKKKGLEVAEPEEKKKTGPETEPHVE